MTDQLEILSRGQLTENPHILRRLVYVKSIYLEGVEHYNSNTEFERAIAVLLYDNSIEMLMNATIEYFGGQVKDDKFDNLLTVFKNTIQKINSNPSKLIHEPEIKNMRRAKTGRSITRNPQATTSLLSVGLKASEPSCNK